MTKAQYHQKHHVKRQKNAAKPIDEGSNEDVLLRDVKHLIQTSSTGNGSTNDEDLAERFSEIEVNIKEISSTGDGLGVVKGQDHVYVVPFTTPGDVVTAKVVNHFSAASYSLTDFVKVVKAGPGRNDALVKCQYFAKCGGCQFQMLPYEMQLSHKKSIVEKAYRNYSGLTPEVVPEVGNTFGSPLQYGYRTKLTPHFDGPPGSMSRRRQVGGSKGFESVPPIGYQAKGMRRTIDIEDCPIGTDAVREGMKRERARVVKELANYRKGATLLLRETTLRGPQITDATKAPRDNHTGEEPAPQRSTNYASAPVATSTANPEDTESPMEETKGCITDSNAIATEYVDDFIFKNTAGSFFQNNNSILSTFTAYIRDHIHQPTAEPNQIKYLVDAYCGSGLFTITLSSLFSSSMGIDISEPSIAAARSNATLNNISNASFMSADATRLFDKLTFPADKTVVVIDPPRKGCDTPFLQQLLRFGPRRVVYVSCNVHTQARDVGVLVEGGHGVRYELESLQGFDFFPQTGHVESVAILSRGV